MRGAAGRLAKPDGALERRSPSSVSRFAIADPHADAGALADLGRAPRQVRQLGDQLEHEVGLLERGPPSPAKRVRSWSMISISCSIVRG